MPNTKRDLNKTDRFLNIVLAIVKAKSHQIDDSRLRDLLGHPSKSQYHKYILELTQDKPGHKAVLNRHKHKDYGFIYYLREDYILAKDKKRPKLTLVSDPSLAEIKIWGNSVHLFKEMNIAHDLIHQTDDYHQFKCQYDEESEFLRTIFQMADDIEIISPSSLKKEFIQKAQRATFLNMSTDYELKKAA